MRSDGPSVSRWLLSMSPGMMVLVCSTLAHISWRLSLVCRSRKGSQEIPIRPQCDPAAHVELDIAFLRTGFGFHGTQGFCGIA